MSLRGLEAAMGHLVTAQAIGKYERDQDMPSSRVLSALADSLHVSEDYLLGTDELALDGVEFRKTEIPSKREESFVQGQALHLLERYLALESVLGLMGDDACRLPEQPYRVADLEDAELAAVKLRTEWDLGIDPVPNLSELLEEGGIKILSIDLKDIDGLTARVVRKDGTALPVIAVKSSAWSERKRFTLAHELGHLVMNVVGETDVELAANRFAGAFLMPKEALHREIGQHRRAISLGELLAIKQVFRVSFQAITHRCHDLGIIRDAAYQRLFQLFSERGWRTFPYEEPGAISPLDEEPRRMERLCFRALSEKLIGESRAAEILRISVRELTERMDRPTLR